MAAGRLATCNADLATAATATDAAGVVGAEATADGHLPTGAAAGSRFTGLEQHISSVAGGASAHVDVNATRVAIESGAGLQEHSPRIAGSGTAGGNSHTAAHA